MSVNCPICGDKKLRGGGVLVVVDDKGEVPTLLCATDIALVLRSDWRTLATRHAAWRARDAELFELMESAVQRVREMA